MIIYTGKDHPNYVQFAHAVRTQVRKVIRKDTPEIKAHFIRAAYNVGLTPETTFELFEALVDLEEMDDA